MTKHTSVDDLIEELSHLKKVYGAIAVEYSDIVIRDGVIVIIGGGNPSGGETEGAFW